MKNNIQQPDTLIFDEKKIRKLSLEDTRLVCTLALVGSLITGCSDTPEVKDYQKNLEGFWSDCSVVKPENLKKENGIDNGNNTYTVMFSYDAVVQRDVSFKERAEPGPRGEDWDEENCPALNVYYGPILTILAKNGLLHNESEGDLLFKKGESIHLTPKVNFIKSENGWIMQ